MNSFTLARSFSLLVVCAVGAALPPSAQNIYICGDRDLPLVMQQVDMSWREFDSNNSGMATYNRYMDIFRYTPSDGTYGRNGTSEFAGYPSSDSLERTWGFQWGPGDLAFTLFRWSGPCSRIVESDVAFNPSVRWAYDAVEAETQPSRVYYMTALMHELGHTVGLMTNGETYQYDQPSVMHGYNPGMVYPTDTLHAPEAYLIRRQYSSQTTLRSMSDMAVFSHWAARGLHNSFTDKTSYRAGENLVVNNLTIENTGSRDLREVHVRLFLSTGRTISTNDTLIGDWVFGSFPKEVLGVYDFTASIPPTMPRGTYFVGALMTSGGYGTDDLRANDTTYLFAPIAIQESCSADRFEPNGAASSATPVGDATYPGLRICTGDEDWFSVALTAGQALDAEVQFSHRAGDIDMRLLDPDGNEIDNSLGVSDSERVGFSSAPRTGTYRLRVFGLGSMDNGYTLSVDLGAQDNPGGGGGGGGGGGSCSVGKVPGPSNLRDVLVASWWMILVLMVIALRAHRSAAVPRRA